MKKFLLDIVSSALGFAIAASLFGLVFLFLLIAAAAGGSERPAGVPRAGVLVVDLTRPVTDRGPAAGPGSLSGALLAGEGSPIALRAATAAIRHAATDARITALFLRGGDTDSGWASMREISLAVADFAKSKKPVIAWAPNWSEKTWYAAAAAKPLALAPDGTFELNGLAAQVFYYAGALRKLGVEMQVTRVGKYKSAVEPFLLDSMSPENREQMEGFLGALDRTFVDEAAAARGVAAATLETIAREKGLLLAKDAVAAGVADSVLAYDEVLTEIEKHAKRAGGEIPQVDLGVYARDVKAGESTAGTGGRVAVIFAEGEILDGSDDSAVGGDLVAQRIRSARLDSDVKAIVLRVNSPGGSAQASEAILRELRLAKGAKPVVVSMGDLAASGGYWIASLADEIVAHPNTLTGSIGVFGMFPSVGGLAEQAGVKVEVVKTAPHADAMSLFRARSPEELAVAQTFVDRIYEDFLDRVSEGRSLPREQVHDLAQGRVWAGSQAMERKLVDTVGGLDDAIRSAAARAKLPAGHGVTYVEPEPGFFAVLSRDLADDDSKRLARAVEAAADGVPVASDLARALRTARRMGRGGVWARLPFDVSVR